MFRIQIPKPCHEEWTSMKPTQKGAFCAACSKEVVDFTAMTDEEVQHYFLQKPTEQKTCGRFRQEQVERIRIHLPENILLQKIAGWKKYMAILLMAFGSMLFGCDVGTDNHLTGLIDAPVEKTLTGDTIMMEPTHLIGKTIQSTADTTKCTVIMDTISYDDEIMGDISIYPIIPVDSVPTIDTIPIPKASMDSLLSIKNTPDPKPTSDTSKCKDAGYY